VQAVDFLLRVERRDRRLARFQPAAVLALRILALQVGRVLEDQSGQRDRSRRGVDRSLVIEAGQEGQAAGVIEVRVREHDGVQFLQRAGGREAVRVFELLRALEQAAVDHHVRPVGLDDVRRSGHLTAGRSEQRDLHRFGAPF